MHVHKSPKYVNAAAKLKVPSHDFSRTVRKRPRSIARPTSAQEVVKVIQEAGLTGVPLTFQGPGHSQNGQSLSDIGTLVDMKGLNAVDDVRCGEVTMEAGALAGGGTQCLSKGLPAAGAAQGDSLYPGVRQH